MKTFYLLQTFPPRPKSNPSEEGCENGQGQGLDCPAPIDNPISILILLILGTFLIIKFKHKLI